MDGASGLIWWSTRAATVGLVVEDGKVVDCPPYARKWAYGRDARDLWKRGVRDGAALKWLPEGHYLLRGLIWWPARHARLALAVDGERVVDCPPYMAPQLRGKAATAAWRAGRVDGVDLRWVPTSEVPTSVQLHLTGHTQLRRWRHPGDISAWEHFASLGTLSEGRWYVGDTSGNGTWTFPSMVEAAAAAVALMAGDDRYVRYPAGYDGLNRPLPDPEVPGLDELLNHI